MPSRHRSLHAVFDHSWQLLAEYDRKVFIQLSIFRGGFTREALIDVTGASARDLLNLVNKSFIQADVETQRYDVHELLRQ